MLSTCSTDWLSASVAVVPGSTITVVFGIGDFGDAILDSAQASDISRLLWTGHLSHLDTGPKASSPTSLDLHPSTNSPASSPDL